MCLLGPLPQWMCSCTTEVSRLIKCSCWRPPLLRELAKWHAPGVEQCFLCCRIDSWSNSWTRECRTWSHKQLIVVLVNCLPSCHGESTNVCRCRRGCLVLVALGGAVADFRYVTVLEVCRSMLRLQERDNDTRERASCDGQTMSEC